MISIRLSAQQKQIGLQIAAGIAALLVWVAPIPRLKSLSQTAPQPPTIPTLPNEESLPNMQQLIARPLFAQSRRPPPPVIVASPAPVTVAAKPLPTTNGMILLGVLHDGSTSIALVTLPGDPVPREVALGAVLEDWIVTKISGDRIFLHSGDTSTELILPQPSASATPAGTGQNSPPMFFPNLSRP